MDNFTFDGFEQANTVPVPDVLFDKLLLHLNEAQLKVMLYIIRRTLGFKKTADAISLNQFRWGITTKEGKKLDGGCGLKNFTSITKALRELERMNCIESEKRETGIGDQDTTVYRIRFRGTTQNVVPTTQDTVPPLSNVVGVLHETEDGTTPTVEGVLRQTYPQETVLQETVKQERVRTITEERTMEEESTGEQTNTTTSAPSLSLDAALSDFSDNETQSQGDTHATTPLDCLPGDLAAVQPRLPGDAIVAPESRTPGDLGTPHGVQPAPEHDVPDVRPEIDEEWCNAETEHRLPAIPKTGTPLGGTSHEQNRDAFPPRSVAVESDLGAVASAPIPPALPEVTPPRTIKATVVSADGPQLSVVPPKGRRGKNVEQDKPAVIPKCDTREIQRRINDHRGYALEEDVDIIRERKAIKTWCNLHSLEDYSAVMEALKRDKYWGKDENYYRIGGLTLLKETARILAGREQTIATPANGQGRTQQWRSSFDDPDYDMSAEFYPNQAVQ